MTKTAKKHQDIEVAKTKNLKCCPVEQLVLNWSQAKGKRSRIRSL
jgi:hypothetical protein